MDGCRSAFTDTWINKRKSQNGCFNVDYRLLSIILPTTPPRGNHSSACVTFHFIVCYTIYHSLYSHPVSWISKETFLTESRLCPKNETFLEDLLSKDYTLFHTLGLEIGSYASSSLPEHSPSSLCKTPAAFNLTGCQTPLPTISVLVTVLLFASPSSFPE